MRGLGRRLKGIHVPPGDLATPTDLATLATLATPVDLIVVEPAGIIGTVGYTGNTGPTGTVGVGNLDLHDPRRPRTLPRALPRNLPRNLPQVLPEPPQQPHPRRGHGIRGKLGHAPIGRNRAPEHQQGTASSVPLTRTRTRVRTRAHALNLPHAQGQRQLHRPAPTGLDGVALHDVRVLSRIRRSDPQGPAIRDRVPPDTYLQSPGDSSDPGNPGALEGGRFGARVLLEPGDRPGNARGVGEHVPQPPDRNRNEHLMVHESREYPA